MSEMLKIKLAETVTFVESRMNKYGELHLTGRETDQLLTLIRRLIGGVVMGQKAHEMLKELESNKPGVRK